jgi:DNA ligase 4
MFHELYENLFNPLNENKQQPGPHGNRSKAANRGGSKPSPNELRRGIIERFVSRWRAEVGDDFYPALRLILPNQDRDRGVYGLKENAIGKLLVKVMKIDRNSDDGYSLLHWKLPGGSRASRMAGDFAGRCYEVLSKRPQITKPGDMRIAEVNVMLDRLAAASGEAEQLPLFETFYQRMNPTELMWLVRIILKQMRVGATERTFLYLWHPDAEALFNVSSSLRRVCWELYNTALRLDNDDTNVALMQIFQPQLAQYQVSTSFKTMVEKLLKGTDSSEYWIEEKLDGERMQVHMMEDDSMSGGKRFGFWSRKAKDYTYLYGKGFNDRESALTQHLKGAFAPGVRNIILDGEMITWDMELDKIVAFGTLKTAALAGKKNPYDETGSRAVFRVFDILFLNDQDLTRYTLKDRRNALEKAVPGVHRRLERHDHVVATSPDEIEPRLRQIVEESSEGLVLKNPLSMYSLNQRNDDWIKVKPEYTQEFGQSVDVLIIGASYGSGHRGGRHSTFLCGLRATQNDIDGGHDPEKCYSFIRVGGGLKAQDYKEIASRTEGKWMDWDSKRPPTKYIELAGGDRQWWKPDQWIRPKDSVVISVKAASSAPSDQYAAENTLRFPRFKFIRDDRAWDSALDCEEFADMRRKDFYRQKEKAMNLDSGRRKVKRVKKEVVIAGQDDAPVEFEGPKTKVFEGLEFCVLTESIQPKKSKMQLETLLKENGGKISQRAVADSEMILIGDKKVVKVASLIKAGAVDIIKPRWILDCLSQSDARKNFLLPYEPSHLFHVSDILKEQAQENVDQYGDSYARDIDLKELKNLLEDMPKNELVDGPFNADQFLEQLEERGHNLGRLKGHIFRGIRIYLAKPSSLSSNAALKFDNWVQFGGGKITEELDDASLTHIVLLGNSDDATGRELAAEIRAAISNRTPVPRVVTQQWLEECWEETTLLAEERYATM